MNEKMYTDLDHKVRVTIENFGTMERVSLEEKQNGIAHTTFANLAWLCECDTACRHEKNIESFIAPREKIASVIKSFRAVNVKQARRGKGQWKQSPFLFRYLGQRQTYYHDLDIVPHKYKVSSFEAMNFKEEGV